MRKADDSPGDAYAVVESKRVYEGKIVKVRQDRVRMPAGNVAPREVVETTDAVAVVAVDERGQVCLIRQYRHAQGGFVWELPAGRLDVENEPPLETAQRELREEVGLVSDSWTPLTTFFSSPGFATERIQLFLAERVHAAGEADAFEAEDEELGIVSEMRSLKQAIDDVASQKLQDAKTIVGLLLAEKHLRQ